MTKYFIIEILIINKYLNLEEKWTQVGKKIFRED
jgi:hypothetical protein